MAKLWLLGGMIFLLGTPPGTGEDGKVKPNATAEAYQVPYQLTRSLHLHIRAKINGHGPFNFIVDTGAPLLILSTSAAKKIGLKTDEDKWVTLDRFEVEGGAIIPKMKCLVDTPFQLEGMNGMGMAGVELHGIVGYTVLARFRIEFDLTRDRMTWTRLHFKPPEPERIKVKSGGGTGLEVLGSLMKYLGAFLGRSAEGNLKPRGYIGIELAEQNGKVIIQAVYPNSPADLAGLRPGDRIDEIQKVRIAKLAEVQRAAARVTAGEPVRFMIERGSESKAITVTAGEGL
jgi:hypothetical protein